MNAFLTLLDPAILPFLSLYHFIHPVKSTRPALMVALWPQAVGPSPNGRPGKVVQPHAGGTGGRPAAEAAPSHPAETRKGEVKLVCRPEPRNQGALGSPEPSESHLHHPGTRARLLESLSTGGGRCKQNRRLTAEPQRPGAPLPQKPAPALPRARRGGSGSRIPLFRFRFPEG